ncbi:hypothetical protein TURU_038707 [Turdus rufiventris]|nr:hypothetical protein TURU_038707 [Turdus rufiventris]
MTVIICLDLCQMFDTVLHNTLDSKLERHGFDRWTTRGMRNWLDGHTQRAVVNSLMSAFPGISGIEHTLSRFANDTELCGAVSSLEGRNLDRLERWLHVNLMRVSKAKCKVLYLAEGSPKNMEGVHGWEVGTE